jgi:transcriptional regulator with GAF, ATPase, and Fis domain
LHDALLQAKREIILHAVEQVGGNWTEAARSLGVHPNHLFRLARTLELKSGKRSTSGKAL